MTQADLFSCINLHSVIHLLHPLLHYAFTHFYSCCQGQLCTRYCRYGKLNQTRSKHWRTGTLMLARRIVLRRQTVDLGNLATRAYLHHGQTAPPQTNCNKVTPFVPDRRERQSISTVVPRMVIYLLVLLGIMNRTCIKTRIPFPQQITPTIPVQPIWTSSTKRLGLSKKAPKRPRRLDSCTPQSVQTAQGRWTI